MLGCQVIQICWCLVWTKLFLSPRSNKGQFCCWAATKGFWKCPSWIPELMNSWIDELKNGSMIGRCWIRWLPDQREGVNEAVWETIKQWVSQSETKGSSGDASASKNGQIGYFQHFLGVPRKTCMFSMVLCIISCDDDSFENPQRRKGMWVCSDMCCCIVCATYICQGSFYRVKFW